MTTGPAQESGSVAAPKSKEPSSLRMLLEMLLAGSILAVLKRLHNTGVLLPGLSKGQFYGVLIGTLIVLGGVAFLVERYVVRKRKQASS